MYCRPSAHWTFIYEDSRILADAVVEMLHGGETDSSKIYSYHSKLQDKQNSHNTGDLWMKVTKIIVFIGLYEQNVLKT